MAYRALYREWRPKDFSHVIGQNPIVETLRNQVINKRIAHAYLFCGSRGTGKTSTAKILAKAVNCLEPENGDPCGKCENCLRADHEETLDVIEIDAASNNGVDEIRNLRDTVKYPPQYGTYKIYIIDEVHMLSPAAFNALLKTLEEPPAHVVFILATTEPQKLPETILSRCQRFDFGRIPVHEIAGRLKEAADGAGAKVTDGALMLIARAAEGGMRDALSILDMCLGYSDHVDEKMARSILGTSDASFLFDFCQSMAERDAGNTFSMIDRLMREGKDPGVFAKDICRHIRSLLIAQTCPEDMSRIMDITEEEATDYVRQGNQISLSRLMKILDVFMELEGEMRYSASPRIALENASLKCCLKIEEADNRQALIDRIGELEKRVDELQTYIKNGHINSQKEDIGMPAEKKDKAPAALSARKVSSEQQKRTAGTTDLSVWNELMNRIQKKDITAWSFLSQGTFTGQNGQRFHWQATERGGEQQYIAALNKPERNRIICSILNEITGEECSFSADPHGTVVNDDGSDEAYLETIYETFGREPVDIIDDM